ncbi:MAG TPA: hypothetical protein VGP26_27905 [Actinophytocola sp.]|jgi:hypothetical protein|nr:hypothetical protein [Actinophytocola sp.]
MDVTTVREIAAALVVFGATGAASMALYQLALKSFDVDLLPDTLTTRVRWWRGHLATALGLSATLLVVGLAGLLLL